MQKWERKRKDRYVRGKEGRKATRSGIFLGGGGGHALKWEIHDASSMLKREGRVSGERWVLAFTLRPTPP